MTKDELQAKLHAAGFQIRSEARVQSNDRSRFMLDNGAIVDCLDDGSWTIWGHGKEQVRSALGPQGEVATPIVGSPIIADTMRVTLDPTCSQVLLELSGHLEPDAPPISSSFLVPESFARELSARLSAGAYQLRQAGLPLKGARNAQLPRGAPFSPHPRAENAGQSSGQDDAVMKRERRP